MPEIPLQNYEKSCNKLLEVFIQKYYCDSETELKDVAWYWIADIIGTTVSINDEFWGMNDIIEALHENPTQDQLFAWYAYRLDCYMENKQPEYNLHSWLKLASKP